MVKQNARTVQLLERIEQSPAVQDAISAISFDMLRTINMIAFDATVSQNMAHEHTGDFCSSSYYRALWNLARMGTSKNIQDSGCVLHRHVYEVVRCGNIRERCFVIMNLLCKETKCHIFLWILQHAKHYKQSVLNMRVIHEYAKKLDDNKLINSYYLRKVLSHQDVLDRTQVRVARKVQDRENFRLHRQDVVPSISHREHRCLLLNRNAETDTPSLPMLPWMTGHMHWELKNVNGDLKQAKAVGNTLICGISGHTDLMLTFCKVFNSYDMHALNLVAMVWLVGSDHHSPCEVLLAASLHGVKYESEDAIFATYKILDKVHARRNHKVPTFTE